MQWLQCLLALQICSVSRKIHYFFWKNENLPSKSQKNNLLMRQEKMMRAVDGKQLFSFRWPYLKRKKHLGHGNENHRFWSPRASLQGYRIKMSLFGQIGQIFHYFENLAIFCEIFFFFQDNLIMFVLKMIGIAWAFQICYSFTIYSIPVFVMTIYVLKTTHFKNSWKLSYLKIFKICRVKLP